MNCYMWPIMHSFSSQILHVNLILFHFYKRKRYMYLYIWRSSSLADRCTLWHSSLRENWQCFWRHLFIYCYVLHSRWPINCFKNAEHLKLGMEGVSGFGFSLQTMCCWSDHVNMGYYFVSQEGCWPCRKWFLTPDTREYGSTLGYPSKKDQ